MYSFTRDRSPYSGCLDYSYDSSQYHSWLYNEKLALTRETLAVLDSQIEGDVYNLPDKIVRAGEDILADIRDTNHDYGSIVLLIALGRVVRIAGAVQGVTSITLETILGSVLVGLSGVLPLLFLPGKLGGSVNDENLKYMLGFAVGGLLGDVFLHLLPETYQHVGPAGAIKAAAARCCVSDA